MQYFSHRYGIGLAFTQKYKNDWRSDAKKAPLGVFQLTGIHWLDLLVYSFGKPKNYRFTAGNLSPYGDSIDVFGMNMEFEPGILAELFFSYVSPFLDNIDIVTADEVIRWENSELILRRPRDTFDSNGLFTQPPVVSRVKADFYSDSLQSSVQYFLSIVKSKKEFKESYSPRNLLSTELFLEILHDLKRK
jgi:predicted dehydrogenase